MPVNGLEPRRDAFAAPVDFVVNKIETHIKSPASQNLKSELRAKEEKRAFYNEIVTIHLLDTETRQPRQGCTWKIPRFRLKQDFLQDLVDKSPANKDKHGCEICYLQDSKGEIILPTQMRIVCKPLPMVYYIVNKKASKILDIEDDSNYEGDMKFVIKGVPRHTQNERYEVNEDDIRGWVIDSILEEDPILQRLRKKVEELRVSIERVATEQRDTPTCPIYKKNGRQVRGKRADKERNIIFDKLSNDKRCLRQEFDMALDQYLNAQKSRFKKLEVQINEERHSLSDNRTTWVVEFIGVHKQYHESLALKKADWKSCPLLHTGCNQTRIEKQNAMGLTDQGYRADAEDVDCLVDIGGVTIERLEDGYGNYHRVMEDRLPRHCDEHVDYYHGLFKKGVMDGHGIIYGSGGVYSGPIKDGKPCGDGSMDYADGDRLTGEFRNTGPICNPYTRGMPSGKGTISFADGSFYCGELEKGDITGTGIYIDASG